MSGDEAAPAGRRSGLDVRGVLSMAGAWLGVSLLFVPQALLLNAARPQPAPWPGVLATNTLLFSLWIVLTPPLLWLAERWPLERGRLLSSAAVHVPVAVGVSLLHVGVVTLLHLPWLHGRVAAPALFGNFLLGLGATNMLLYVAVIVAGHALDHLRRYRAAERARAQAQLSALRAQLEPHFLFNTLNALSELVHRDAPLAERLILRLAELLRRALATSSMHEVSLHAELAFSRAYLEIQQALMGDRLAVEFDVPERLHAAMVPSMLLQPLIENAIRHGLARRRAAGRITVRAYAEDGRLSIKVLDDGVGVETPICEGVGLGNTRARLQTLYGGAASLRWVHRDPGLAVVIELPLRLSRVPAAG